jgi:uncharacterized membrane protein
MSGQLKAIAFSVLSVIAVYFLATVFGKIGGHERFFLPLDILVYLGIGFFSGRSLKSWGGAFVVVLIAALVDGALAVGSLILPEAPHMPPSQITKQLALEFGLNALVGLIGSAVGARTAAAK